MKTLPGCLVSILGAALLALVAGSGAVLSGCLGQGVSPSPVALERLGNAEATVGRLLDLARREHPGAVLALEAVQAALVDARTALEAGRPVTTLDAAQGLVRGLLDARPGGALELGLIALEALLGDLGPLVGPLPTEPIPG